MPFVCVQPMLMSWARRSEDLTVDKTDEKDAVIIARLAAQLRCYVPEPVDETWGRLRHLGARREQLLVEAGGQVQQLRALLECVWPAALATARQPFRSCTWMATMSVLLERDAGDLARTRRLGLARLESAVRREVVRQGRQKPCLPIALLLGDWRQTQCRLLDAQTRMTAILDELKLTELVTSITGLSAIGAAAILAETGDPHRFATARALVKHAGLAPREKLSGAFVGRTKLTGQGRPGPRLAAWRAVWGAQRANPVYAARFTHLTTTANNKLTATQAQAVTAAAILRQLHAVITTGRAWGSGHRHPRHHTAHGDPHRRLTAADGRRARSGRAPRGIEEPRSPRRSSRAAPPVVTPNPITRCPDQPHYRHAETDDGRDTRPNT
jgi:transposase